MKILDIGCGNSKYPGKNSDIVVGLDSSKLPGVDVVHDLEKMPLPFKTGEFDMITAFHVLEHVKDLIPLLEEMHRITKDNGVLWVKVPFYSAWGQFNDPTHVRFFTPFTFSYFQGKNNYSHEVKKNDKLNLKVQKVRIHFAVGRLKFLNWLFDPLLNLSQAFYCRFYAWIFPACEIEYKIRVIKNG